MPKLWKTYRLKRLNSLEKENTKRNWCPRKRKYIKKKAPTESYGKQEASIEIYIEKETLEEVRDKELPPKEAHVPGNYEISMSYVHNRYK